MLYTMYCTHASCTKQKFCFVENWTPVINIAVQCTLSKHSGIRFGVCWYPWICCLLSSPEWLDVLSDESTRCIWYVILEELVMTKPMCLRSEYQNTFNIKRLWSSPSSCVDQFPYPTNAPFFANQTIINEFRRVSSSTTRHLHHHLCPKRGCMQLPTKNVQGGVPQQWLGNSCRGQEGTEVWRQHLLWNQSDKRLQGL